MPKIRKVKRKKSYKANINRKRLRDKLRKLPAIECKDIKDAWENTKSTRHNLGDMGLAYDPNEALKIPNAKRELLEEARKQLVDDCSESEGEKNFKRIPSKVHVALGLEAEAKAPRERMFRLPNQQVQFVTYLMDKYGDDYKAMARDKKNYYQMTWRQIRAKINTFKGIPEQYAEYLLQKGDIILEDPTPLVETRKRIAEENVKKFCTAKPKKVKPPKASTWLEEEMDFDTEDKLEDMSEDGIEKNREATGEPLKKLQLFSDDDNDDEDVGKKKSKSKKTKQKLEIAMNGKTMKKSLENEIQMKNSGKIDKSKKKAKVLETLPSSDSDDDDDDDEGLEGDDEEAGFVDLDELTDEELSEDDILDDGKFVTDSDESD